MKRNKLRMSALLLSLALMIGLLAGCSSSGGSAGESTPPATAPAAGTDAPADANAVAVTEWEIPMLTAATGAIAYVGKPAGWAAEYAAEIINANGGIRGVPVKVTVLDTAFDTSKAVTQMTSVVDNALVVLGPMDAPGAESAGQVAYDGGVPNIAAYSFQDIRDLYAPYVMGYMTDSEEGDLAAAQEWTAVNDDIKKIVIFYTPTDASQAAATELLTAQLPDSGIEVVGHGGGADRPAGLLRLRHPGPEPEGRRLLPEPAGRRGRQGPDRAAQARRGRRPPHLRHLRQL